MSLDFPAFGDGLWSLYDRSGGQLRPEYILPVLWLESGFNPAAVNSISCTGINQRCGNVPAGYASLSASQQLASFVSPMYLNLIGTYGPIRSATRAYQANLLPSTLRTATSLGSVIAEKGSSRTVPQSQLTEGAVYAANSGLDANRDGTITVGDLAVEMRKMLAASAVQSAIAQTYARRPGESPVSDPVLGQDFGIPWGIVDVALVSVALLAAAAGTVAIVRPEWIRRDF